MLCEDNFFFKIFFCNSSVKIKLIQLNIISSDISNRNKYIIKKINVIDVKR